MHKLKRLRKDVGFSIAELAEVSGLSESTIRGIEEGTSQYRTNIGVAMILADLFDCKVEDIFDSTEVSHLGRPPLTGVPIGRMVKTVEITVTANGQSETLKLTHELEGELCNKCWLVMPLTGACPFCD